MKCILSILFVVCLCGCNGSQSHTSSSESHVPKLDTPARPQQQTLEKPELDEYGKLSSGLRAKLEGNDREVKRYAEKLEVTVKAYNTYAEIHNQHADALYVTPAKPAPTAPVIATPESLPSLGGGK